MNRNMKGGGCRGNLGSPTMKQCCADPATKCIYYKCDFSDCKLCLIGTNKEVENPALKTEEIALNKRCVKEWLGRNIGFHVVRDI
jgi:hypothetical protein